MEAMDMHAHDHHHDTMEAHAITAAASVNLLITCLAMFLGAYAAGMAPRLLPLSDSRLQTVNTIGAGLLIGTALCVIVPEGFSALNEAQEHSAEGHSHGSGWVPGLTLLLGFMGMLLLENLSHYITTTMKPAAKGHVSPPDANTPADTPKASQSTSSSGAVRTTATLTAAGKASPDSAATGKGKSDTALNTPIIDCKPDTEHDADDHEHQHEHGHQHLGCGGHHHPRAAAGAAGAVDPARQAYIGLLVHSLADGLAVGAASLSTNLAVTFTVASAMVLHKGPVAFGLTLYLQSANWDARKRHQALLLFCGMSPLAAILTYGIFSQLPGVTTTMNIALCVLFSGGTFLYAACIHIFPSIVAPDGLVPNMQLPWLVVGSALPLFLSTLVPHHH